MTKKTKTKKKLIHDFFEDPQSLNAKIFQIIIFILIILSVFFVSIEHFYPRLFLQYKQLFIYGEYIILSVFLVEYLIRFFTAPSKLRFSFKPFSIIDFFAIFPSLIEISLGMFSSSIGIRVLYFTKFLRLSRILRTLKLMRFRHIFGDVFRWRGTIIQAIAPILFFFVILKFIAWFFESFEFWFLSANLDANFGELFAIIGFALGIILSQKIATSHNKFLQVEESVIRIHSNIYTLAVILNKLKAGFGTKHCKAWAQEFMTLLSDHKTDNYRITKINARLYAAIFLVEKKPADLANLYNELCRDSIFCLTKETRLTPKAYDILLHQAIILYLFLIVVFIPGLAGLVSILIATYILYGMYNLTQDLDSILGGEFKLINVDISEFKRLVNKDNWKFDQ